MIEELTVSGGVTNLAKVYTPGLALISQRQMPSATVSFYGTDGHGSVRFLASTAGAITDTYTFDAFGTLIASTGTTANNFLFCGEQWDPDLGRYYLRARFYEPGIGRFSSRDTFEGSLTEPPSLHPYFYASANPVNGIDPSGRATEGLEGQVVTQGGMSTLASQSIGAVSRGMISAYVRLPQIIDGASRALWWLEAGSAVIGAGLTIAPEVLDAAANLADSYDRLAGNNSGSFSAGPVVRGVQMEEGVFRQAIEAAGGKFYGGNVKGIDGELAVSPGGTLIQGKSHDVAPDGGKIFLAAVPESQARLISTPEFATRLRELAIRTRTIPIVRAIRNWRGAPR